MCVMTRLFREHCVQSLLRRDIAESSRQIKHLIVILVPASKRKFVPEKVPKSGQNGTI
jgi:hypothetical protein